MGLLSKLFGGRDIDDELETVRMTDNAVLIDVRGADEFAAGHIPGAVNVDVNTIERISEVVPDKDAPVFTYCLSGARSGKAVAALREAGYTNVKNIGGINSYSGPKERG